MNRLSPSSTLFFLCDIQSKFIPLVQAQRSLLFVGDRLTKASQILNCPLIVTEQYPKALGHTAIELPQNALKYDKMLFSMLIPEVQNKLENEYKAYNSVVLFGLEAHVCVQQTCLDLLERGYQVTIVADGTTSQRDFDRKIAFQRMKDAGAMISTSESVLFELMRDATHPNFKEISKLCNTKFVGEIPDPEL